MMTDKKGVLAALLPAMLLGVLIPQDAEACSCIFSCSNKIITDQKLASGAEGFYWFLGGGGVQPGDIGQDALLLEKLVDGAYQAVDHELTYSHPRGTVHIVRPTDGFEIGAKYKLTVDLNGWQSGCQIELDQGTIEAVVSAETEIVSVTPTAKLTAGVTDQKVEEIRFESDGNCEDNFLASYRDVTIELPAELAGMERSLFYEVTVNGESYFHDYNSCSFQEIEPGGLSPDRLTTRLAALCESVPEYAANTALSLGTHEVVVSASLPESDVFKWTSDPIMVELDCPGGAPDMGGSGSDMGPGGLDMGQGPGLPDLGGGGEPDLGGEADMGSEQPVDDMGTSEPDMAELPGDNSGNGGDGGGDDEGCAQGSLGAPAGGSALVLGLLALLGLRRRRRREV